jgi:predicted ester cyclase
MTHSAITTPAADARVLCLRSMRIMVDGSPADFDAVVHPDAVNREAKDEPPAARGRGPAAFYATALWLRQTFADLAFDVHEVAVEGDLVAVHNTMSGRHVGPAITYDAEGRVRQVFPSTGRRFSTTQSHWFRLQDGKVIEHWANRDDLGTALQLGWVPPRPLYLLRTALATRKARRAR